MESGGSRVARPHSEGGVPLNYSPSFITADSKSFYITVNILRTELIAKLWVLQRPIMIWMCLASVWGCAAWRFMRARQLHVGMEFCAQFDHAESFHCWPVGGLYITLMVQKTHKCYPETLKKTVWHWTSHWFLARISQGCMWQQMTCLSLTKGQK